MTKDEAVVAIRKVAGASLTDEDLRGIDGCTQEQLQFIVEGWANIGKVRDEAVWPKILEVVKQVPEWVELATKLAAAIAAVV